MIVAVRSVVRDEGRIVCKKKQREKRGESVMISDGMGSKRLVRRERERERGRRERAKVKLNERQKSNDLRGF